MAILDNSDFTEIKNFIRGNPTIKAEFKVWGLSKQVWKDTFQAAEDWFVSGFNTTPTNSFKAALEAEGGAMTGAQAQSVGTIWMQWRFTQ